jgi:hypothetical protein
MSLNGDVWVYGSSLYPRIIIKVPVPSQNRDMYEYVGGIEFASDSNYFKINFRTVLTV